MEKQIKFRKFGVMLDMSRNAVMNLNSVEKYIDIIADLGYNCLMLYTEDTYEIENHPYFGHNRGRYSADELKALDKYAASKGIELIPCIQTLAHLNAIFRWQTYENIRDCDNILLCGDENTYKLIDDMFASVDKCFTSRTVNIGMDEAYMLGRGKYYDKYGACDRFDILLAHLNKVSKIAEKYGFNLIMWGDMFFKLMSDGCYNSEKDAPEKIKRLIPDNVKLIYWDYYSKSTENYEKHIRAHSALKEDIWFAGGVWTWSGFAPHNKFSLDTLKASFDACVNEGVRDVFITLWGDNGAECSKFAALPSLYYASQLAKANNDIESIKRGFKTKFGISFDDFLLLDLPYTPSGSEKIVNSDKYLFYNDCFMGLFDSVVKPDDGESFGKTAKALENVAKNEYSYLFESAAALCRVLEVKADLGIKTRRAYEARSAAELETLITEYDKVISLTEAFYELFEKQWMTENKPHGFDVQDIRIGGLLQRIKHCRKQLLRFINGEIDRLEELEENRLDVLCRETNDHLDYNLWKDNVTSNVL